MPAPNREGEVVVTDGLLEPYGCTGGEKYAGTYCNEHCPEPERCDDEHGMIIIFTESDTPEHCETCGAMLPVALTSEGKKYVVDELSHNDNHPVITAIWRKYYGKVM